MSLIETIVHGQVHELRLARPPVNALNPELCAELVQALREAGLHLPVVVGGIIPDEDAAALRAMGVAAVYTPKDFELNRIMLDLVALADPAQEAAE